MVLVKIIFGLEVNVDSISLVPDSFDGVFCRSVSWPWSYILHGFSVTYPDHGNCNLCLFHWTQTHLMGFWGRNILVLVVYHCRGEVKIRGKNRRKRQRLKDTESEKVKWKVKVIWWSGSKCLAKKLDLSLIILRVNHFESKEGRKWD